MDNCKDIVNLKTPSFTRYKIYSVKIFRIYSYKYFCQNIL